MLKPTQFVSALAAAFVGLLAVTSSASAYYEVDYAHIVKIGLDTTHCDATVCRVYVYFDKNINLPAGSCNSQPANRAVLWLYKSNSADDTAVGLDKIYSAAMSAYLAGTQVYARVTGCDATVSLTRLYYLENK